VAAESPAITAVDPDRAMAEEAVRIQGPGLSAATAVFLGDLRAPFTALAEPDVLEVRVPAGAVHGGIAVDTPLGRAVHAGFEVLPTPPEERPAISLCTPRSGFPGDEVTLVGPGLAAAAAVAFNGATTEARPGTAGVTATVPAGAATGPLAVVLGDGTRIPSSVDFTVLAPASARPGVERIAPAAALAGTRVTVTGTHLDLVTAAQVGGVPVRLDPGTPEQFTFRAPAFPARGPLTLVTAGGRIRAGVSFTTLAPPPGILSLTPRRGRAGTPVLILGRDLADTTSVAFGGVAAPALLDASRTSVRVQVPSGAVSGPVTVTTPGGTATAAPGFTVTPAPPATRVVIAAAYLTQATQTLEGLIPLVAGRDGVLRVFLEANQANNLRPKVRVTLRHGDGQVLVDQVVQLPTVGVPTRVDEYQLQQSCNLTVPGHLIQAPELRLKVELLPDGMPDRSGAIWPRGGRPQSLRVMALPPLKLTLIPITWPTDQGLATGNITRGGRTLASWVENVKALYPVSEVQLTEGAPYSTDLPPDYRQGDEDRAWVVLRELEAARLANGDALAYWYGVFAYNHDGEFGMNLGVSSNERGQLADRVSLGHDALGQADGRNYPQTLAHELAHAMGLEHALCFGEAGVDPSYPHPGATLGSAGFDVRHLRPIDPQFHRDLMSYCSPRWISDYSYLQLIRGRLADQRRGRADVGPVPALLVSGTLHGDRVTLDPAMELQARVLPPRPGPNRLTGLDAAGTRLFQVTFAAGAGEDADEPPAFSFSLGLAPEVRARLAVLKVETPTGASAVRAARSAAAPPVRDPVAVHWRPGVVHLGWDPGAYPRVMVRDPRSGRFIATGSTGSLDLATDAGDLELCFSDGVRTTVRKLTVR